MAMSGNAFNGGGGGSFWDNAFQSGRNSSQGFFGLLQSLFNNNKSPYGEGFNATQPYYEGAKEFQNPFVKQGQEASGKFNSWLDNMQNPTEFINKIMGSYSQSPWAKNLESSAVRAGTNAASASGLTGSTPFAQQLQQTGANISSQDMQNFLQNVLGINSAYGAGENMQVERGQHASDILSQLFSNQGNMAGGAAYGDQAWENQNSDSTWANIAKMFGG